MTVRKKITPGPSKLTLTANASVKSLVEAETEKCENGPSKRWLGHSSSIQRLSR